jgi:hypothetical protein
LINGCEMRQEKINEIHRICHLIGSQVLTFEIGEERFYDKVVLSIEASLLCDFGSVN